MAGARSALVVAAHEFVDPKFSQLRSPVHDVESLVGVLGDDGIGAFDVKTVVNQPGAVVQQELERFFSDRKPDDLLLLYFSCHGVKDAAGRLYFVTSNTTFDLLRSTGISASFVSEQMEYSRSKRIVVLLDCCYSGAFLKGFRARGDDAVAVEQLEGRGRAVITASRATEYAFEADEMTSENAQASVFTSAIVEGLASGRADANGDGLVTVDELYDYVYDAVRGKVAGQTPGRWIDVEGDLVVARNRNLVVPAPPAPSVPPPVVVPLVAPPPPPVVLEPMAAGTPVARSDDFAAADAPAGAIRTAAILAAVGGVAVLLAPYLPFLEFGDSSFDTLAKHAGYSLRTFVLFVLGAGAAAGLLRRIGSPGYSLAVLIGLLPIALADVVLMIAEVAEAEGAKPQAGWFVVVFGLLALVSSGVISAACMRSLSTLSLPRIGEAGDLQRGGLLVGALLTGAAAAVGWARLLNQTGDALFGVSATAQDVAVRMMLLVAVLLFGWRWVAAGKVGALAFAGGGIAVFVAIAAAYLLSYGQLTSDTSVGPWTGKAGLPAIAYSISAVGASVVPPVSVVLVPVRAGAMMLVSWVAAGAAVLPAAIAEGVEGELLAVVLLAAGVLAGVLATKMQRT